MKKKSKKQTKPIKAKCTCRSCPPDTDDMFWRQDEELACEQRAEEYHKGKQVIVEHN